MANYDEYSRGDAVRWYYSGAGSDGGTQADPDASLGNYRSSTEVPQMSYRPYNMMPYVTVGHVAGANGEGTGELKVESANTLSWKAPSGTAGTAVTITNGQTKVLESGGANPHKYIRVSRTSATDLDTDYISLLTLSRRINDVGGMTNLSDSERSAGENKVRCLVMKNHSSYAVTDMVFWVNALTAGSVTNTAQLGASGAGTITTGVGTFAAWSDRGFARIQEADTTLREIVYYSSRTSTSLTVPATGRALLGTSASAGVATDTVREVPGLRIALEAPTASQFTTASDENDMTGMGGWTWYKDIDSSSGCTLSSLAASGLYALWLWLAYPASGTGHWLHLNSIGWQFGAV